MRCENFISHLFFFTTNLRVMPTQKTMKKKFKIWLGCYLMFNLTIVHMECVPLYDVWYNTSKKNTKQKWLQRTPIVSLTWCVQDEINDKRMYIIIKSLKIHTYSQPPRPKWNNKCIFLLFRHLNCKKTLFLNDRLHAASIKRNKWIQKTAKNSWKTSFIFQMQNVKK